MSPQVGAVGELDAEAAAIAGGLMLAEASGTALVAALALEGGTMLATTATDAVVAAVAVTAGGVGGGTGAMSGFLSSHATNAAMVSDPSKAKCERSIFFNVTLHPSAAQ